MDEIWAEMYAKAEEQRNARSVSDGSDGLFVSVALLSAADKIYTGVYSERFGANGICAGLNAVFSMTVGGEKSIKRFLGVGADGKTVPPCATCRRVIAQTMREGFDDIEVMLDYDKGVVVKFGELRFDGQ